MSVTGFLALYTTLLGWQQYNNLWNIAVSTGIIYWPFLAIVLSNTVEPFTSMGAKDAAQIAVRRLVIQLIIALLVIEFAARPTVDLDPKVLHYQPVCETLMQTATPGHTGTTYDQSFPVPTGVKVPLFWYLVMAISNGITEAANRGLPCSPIHYRQLHTQLDATHITDPQLQQDIRQFYQDCYVPAYSNYLSGKLTPAQQTQVQQSLQQNGSDDIGWMGSQTFLNITGFYDAQQATKPIQGFAFNPERDFVEGQINNHSPWGQPNCKTWWNGSDNGLRARLAKTLPHTFWQQLDHINGDIKQLQNASLKTLVDRYVYINTIPENKARGYSSLNDAVTGDWFSRFVTAPLGVEYEELSFYPKLHLLMNALPVIQGSLLFALYAFLGLAIPFSRYHIQFCVTGAIVIFSVIFCSFLWNLTQWFDNYLIQALYPSLGKVPGMQGILNDTTSPNELFTDMIIAALYVVLPLLWLTVMGWAGFQAGQHVAHMVGSMSLPATSAGNRGGSLVTKRLP